ncbi:Vacuolar protein sorting-associated protein 20 [Malassezia sp. CBS 17886]|nr:Vacuolar protein sorting-associated protein 20 [Malassezia sp. CBS 17886]
MGAARSKGVAVTEQDRSILELKLQRDRVRQYQRKLQHVLQKEHELARQALARGDKVRARLALRQRAYQRGLIEKTDQQLATLQELVSTIEFAQLQQSVMFGLQQGGDVLRAIQKETDLDRVDQLMSSAADAQAYQREVSERLASQLSADERDGVEEELARLERDVAGRAHLPGVPAAEPEGVPPALPAAPTAAVAAAPLRSPLPAE